MHPKNVSVSTGCVPQTDSRLFCRIKRCVILGRIVSLARAVRWAKGHPLLASRRFRRVAYPGFAALFCFYRHSSRCFRRSTADLHLPEELAEAFLDMPGGKSDGGKAAPLLLLGEHVCALSLEKKEKQLESGGKFTLREPYSWESDLDVAGFALPRWMWDAVGGETVS